MRSTTMAKAGAVLAAAAATPLIVSGVAQAEPAGTVHFSYGLFNCAINDGGDVGCDVNGGTSMSIALNTGSGNPSIPVPFRVNQVVIDVPWAPAHPGFTPGMPYTLPGGNPNIVAVGHPTGSGATAGSEVTHAGASCASGFHGSFSCKSKGHSFFHYEGITAD